MFACEKCLMCLLLYALIHRQAGKTCSSLNTSQISEGFQETQLGCISENKV